MQKLTTLLKVCLLWNLIFDIFIQLQITLIFYLARGVWYFEKI